MPSRLASDAEMAALVGAMGEGGRGVYMLTKGGHTKVSFLESLAAATGRPVMVAALLHNSVAPRAVFDDLDAIAAANARGHRLLGQVSCCALTMDFTLASPYPGRRSDELEAGARPVGRRAQGGARRPRVPRRRPRRAEDGDDVSPLQRRMGQGPRRRDSAAGARAPRTAEHRRDRRRRRPRPARHDARHRPRRRPEDGVHGAAAEQRRGRGRPDAQPPAQHRQPERRRRPSDFLQRRRLRPAPARPLGARPRRDDARRGGAPADVAPGERARSGRIAARSRAGQAADLLLFDPKTVGRGPKRRVHDLPGGRSAPDDRCGRRARRVGQRPAGRRRPRPRSPTRRSRASC